MIRYGLTLALLVSGCAEDAPTEATPTKIAPTAPQTAERQPGLYGQGRDAVLTGRYADAVRHLERYIERNPTGQMVTTARLYLGKAHLGLGDLDAAQAAFAQGAREAPDSPAGHKSRYKLACVQLMKGDVDAAKRTFEQVAAADPPGQLTPEARAFARALEKR